MALANAGRLPESLVCFEKAVKISPQNPTVWNNKGVVLRELGRYQEALSCFDKAIELDPSYEVARKNREYTLQDLNWNSNEVSRLSTGQML
jgi:tetratricopeptide (TPR) repeat protein